MSGQLWQKDEYGGFLYHDELSELLRIQAQPLMRFRAACDAEDGSQKGFHAGDMFWWDAVEDIEKAGRALRETERIPTSRFVIRQRSLQIREYGMGVPFTGFLEDIPVARPGA